MEKWKKCFALKLDARSVEIDDHDYILNSEESSNRIKMSNMNP